MDSALFTANPYGLTFTETALACVVGLLVVVGMFAIGYALARWAHGWRKKFWTMKGE